MTKELMALFLAAATAGAQEAAEGGSDYSAGKVIGWMTAGSAAGDA